MEQGLRIKGNYHAMMRNMDNTGTSTSPQFSNESIINNTASTPFYIKGASVTHAAFDFDTDGDCDFFIGNGESIYYAENDGNNNLKVVDTIVTGRLKPIRGTLGDLNNDNAIDLVYVSVSKTPPYSMPKVFIKWGIPGETKTTFKNEMSTNETISLIANNRSIILKSYGSGANIFGVYDMQGKTIALYNNGVVEAKLPDNSVKNRMVIAVIRNKEGKQFTKTVCLMQN